MVLIAHWKDLSAALRDKNNGKKQLCSPGSHCALSLLTSQLSACAAPAGQGVHPLSHSQTNSPGLVSFPQLRALPYKTALDIGTGPTFPQLLIFFLDLFHFMFLSVLLAHTCTPSVCLVPVEVRGKVFLLELELQMSVSHTWVLGVEPMSAVRMAGALNL